MAILNGKMKDHGFLRVFGVPVISHIVCWKIPQQPPWFQGFPISHVTDDICGLASCPFGRLAAGLFLE